MLNGPIKFNLKKIDLFDKQLPLTFKKDYFHNTNLGGVLTILNIILILILLFFLINDLSNGNNFTIFSNKSEYLNSGISFSNIPMALSVSKSFNITANYGSQNIELTTCEEFIHYNKYYNDLKNLRDFTNYQCIRPDINLILREKYKEGLKILIRKDNTNIISDLNIIFLNYYLDHSETDIDNIIIPKLYTKEISLSSINPNYKKIFYLIFEQGNYFLYNNVFLNSKKQISKFHLYKGYEYDYETNDFDKSIIAEINFISNSLLISYYKKFESFWDVLAKIGGILYIILLLTKKINDYISKKIFFIDIYNYFSSNRDIYSEYHNKLNKIFHHSSMNTHTINNLSNINLSRFSKQKKDKEIDNSHSNFILLKNSSILQGSKNLENKGNTVNDEQPIFNKKSIIPPPIVVQSKLSNNMKKRVIEWHEKNVPKCTKILFYLCPECLINKIGIFHELVLIKNNVINVFSFENIYKLVMLEKIIIERENIKYRNNNRSFKVNRFNK